MLIETQQLDEKTLATWPDVHANLKKQDDAILKEYDDDINTLLTFV